MGEGLPGSGMPKTPPTPLTQTSATEEEEEEGRAEFGGAAPRAPLLCPPRWCHGQERREMRAVPGRAAPAARSPTTKSMSRTPRPAPASSHRARQGGGHGDVGDARHNLPHPLPAHPAGQTAPPEPAPGATEPRTAPGPTSERHRRVLCYFAFVVTRRRVPVPIVPSPCPPPHPSHSPPSPGGVPEVRARHLPARRGDAGTGTGEGAQRRGHLRGHLRGYATRGHSG